jgi:hypothetical protein
VTAATIRAILVLVVPSRGQFRQRSTAIGLSFGPRSAMEKQPIEDGHILCGTPGPPHDAGTQLHESEQGAEGQTVRVPQRTRCFSPPLKLTAVEWLELFSAGGMAMEPPDFGR